MPTVILNTPGSSTWTVPSDVQAGIPIAVTAVGGGASGATTSTTYVITPNDVANGIAYTVGAGSSSSNTSWSTNNLNILRNSTNVGAVVGNPGTFPTNFWSPNFGTNPDFGITAQVVAFGVTNSGMPYIDVNYSGTTTSANSFSLFMENIGAASASVNYTFSLYTAYIAGSLTNINSIWMLNDASTAGFAYLSTPIQLQITPTTTLTQYVSTGTTPGTTAILNAYFQIRFSSGVAINVTFRYAGEQLEQASSASFFKSTPGYALAAGGGASGADGSITLIYPDTFPYQPAMQWAPLLAS